MNKCAFPTTIREVGEDGVPVFYSYFGMDLRTYLAGQAMAGYLAMKVHSDVDDLTAARDCVLLADALIAELSKSPE